VACSRMNFTFTLAVRVIGSFQTSGNTQLKQCHIPTQPESSAIVATVKTKLKAGRHRRIIIITITIQRTSSRGFTIAQVISSSKHTKQWVDYRRLGQCVHSRAHFQWAPYTSPRADKYAYSASFRSRPTALLVTAVATHFVGVHSYG
jgi:hypothetical protein